MKTKTIAFALLAMGVIAISGNSYAQKADFGKLEYDSKCSICHGMGGNGDGHYAAIINTGIPDLTTLLRRNNGVYPFQRVIEVIDGGKLLTAHGTRDMPIWGRDYRVQAELGYTGVPWDPEIYVGIRILALAEYIYRLQAK